MIIWLHDNRDRGIFHDSRDEKFTDLILLTTYSIYSMEIFSEHNLALTEIH